MAAARKYKVGYDPKRGAWTRCTAEVPGTKGCTHVGEDGSPTEHMSGVTSKEIKRLNDIAAEERAGGGFSTASGGNTGGDGAPQESATPVDRGKWAAIMASAEGLNRAVDPEAMIRLSHESPGGFTELAPAAEDVHKGTSLPDFNKYGAGFVSRPFGLPGVVGRTYEDENWYNYEHMRRTVRTEYYVEDPKSLPELIEHLNKAKTPDGKASEVHIIGEASDSTAVELNDLGSNSRVHLNLEYGTFTLGGTSVSKVGPHAYVKEMDSTSVIYKLEGTVGKADGALISETTEGSHVITAKGTEFYLTRGRIDEARDCSIGGFDDTGFIRNMEGGTVEPTYGSRGAIVTAEDVSFVYDTDPFLRYGDDSRSVVSDTVERMRGMRLGTAKDCDVEGAPLILTGGSNKVEPRAFFEPVVIMASSNDL
jgi:hypothetical protein